MITCDVIGAGPQNPGLGNQLFVVAATLSLAEDNKTRAVFPDLLYPPYAFYGNTIFSRLDTGKDKSFVEYVYQEPPYTSTIYREIPFRENMILRGHFQSYKYFYHNIETIRQLLKNPQSLTKGLDNKYENLLSCPNTVSVHVRRGDYTQLTQNYATLTDDYYLRALEKIGSYSKIVMFSDDIDWCKDNVLQSKAADIVYIKGELDIADLYLMSRMKNHIVANSTFSVWGALLNDNQNATVVAPKAWFGAARTSNNDIETADLMPPEWLRV